MNKKINILFAAMTVFAMSDISAQNPIIRDQFSADPTARVFEGKLYLYPSHDIPAPADYPRKDWFCMADYHVFSSQNLTDWTDHGVIIDQKNVPWVHPSAYGMWAPDCVYRNGKYYFFFPAVPADTTMRGFGLGVATSDRPYGPFTPEAEPIKGAFGIDPCVLIDHDGQAYLYTGAGGVLVGKLNDDMKSLASKMERVENLPKGGLIEGPFAFERNGWYYLTYPYVKDKTETLAYSMGKSPMGPFEYKGLIMDESPTGCWTNHHSIVEYQGQWYLFYHHNDYSPNFDKNRSVRADKLFFNEDGTIREVTPTLRGVGISNATHEIQIDRYSDKSRNVTIEFLDTTQRFMGWKAQLAGAKDWIAYNEVDFGQENPKSVTVRAASPQDAVLEIRLNDPTGPLLAQIKITKSDAMKEYGAVVKNYQKGVQNLYVMLKKGKSVEVDWVRFGEKTVKPNAQAGRCRNLLLEAGYSAQAIQAKLDTAFYLVFEGPDRVYFEVGDTMAYISDVKNHDVRTEGMSYGMMIAVQFNRQDMFNRLWRWAKKYMQHQGGPRDGYFGWSCKVSGEQNSAGTASDGELYFVTSLLLASNQWGDGSDINYQAEAQRILDAMFAKTGKDNVYNIINEKEKLITFVPEGFGSRFTDPSYHLPVFYEIWAKYADDGRADFWMECARKSREYLHKACHPVTGLNPDYSNYDGSNIKPMRGDWGTKFRFDSWRVPMNIALDYTWSGADAEWQQDYGRRIQAFFRKQGVHTFVDQYNLEGTPVENVAEAGGYKALRHSIGLVGAVTAVSLTQSSVDDCRDFIEEFWNAKLEPYADGYYDGYYDGLLYLFAWMHLSGNYQYMGK